MTALDTGLDTGYSSCFFTYGFDRVPQLFTGASGQLYYVRALEFLTEFYVRHLKPSFRIFDGVTGDSLYLLLITYLSIYDEWFYS